MVTSAFADIGEVVSWLESIEQFVGRLYTSAAKAFAHDTQFSKFLARLAEGGTVWRWLGSIFITALSQIFKCRAWMDLSFTSELSSVTPS